MPSPFVRGQELSGRRYTEAVRPPLFHRYRASLLPLAQVMAGSTRSRLETLSRTAIHGQFRALGACNSESGTAIEEWG